MPIDRHLLLALPSLALLLGACSGGSGGPSDSPSPSAPTSLPGVVDQPTVYASSLDPRVLAFPTESAGTLTAYGDKSPDGLPINLTRLTSTHEGGVDSIEFLEDQLPRRFVASNGVVIDFEWLPGEGQVSIEIDGPGFSSPIVEILPFDFESYEASAPPYGGFSPDKAALFVPIVFGSVVGCGTSGQLPLTYFLDLYRAGTDELIDILLMKDTEFGMWQVKIPYKADGTLPGPVLTFEDCGEIGAFYAAYLCKIAQLASLISDLKSILSQGTLFDSVKALIAADFLSIMIFSTCPAIENAEAVIQAMWCSAFFDGKIVGGPVDLQGRVRYSGDDYVGPRVTVESAQDFPKQVLVSLGSEYQPTLTVTPPAPITSYVAKGTFPCVPPGSGVMVVVMDVINGQIWASEPKWYFDGAINVTAAVSVGFPVAFPKPAVHVIQATLADPSGEPKVVEQVLTFQ